MKRIPPLLIILGLLNLSPLYGDNLPNPLLVIDVKNTKSLPQRYRQCISSYLDNRIQELESQNIPIPSREGLGNLRASASGQFSKKHLEEIKKRTPGDLYIVDLREESHGYLNGDAISWYGGENNTNEGLSLKEIIAQEHTLLGKLRALKTAVVYRIQEKIESTISQAHATSSSVASIMSEAKLARLERVHYIRFPVTDHYPPSAEILQKFLNFYHRLPPQAYLVFHCRGGSGRSTFFMVLCDILKNGHSLSFEEIIYRQYLLGGKNMFPQDSADSIARKGAHERFDSLRSLYQEITGKPAQGEIPQG